MQPSSPVSFVRCFATSIRARRKSFANILRLKTRLSAVFYAFIMFAQFCGNNNGGKGEGDD